MSLACMAVYIVVSLSGSLCAYYLGQAKVYAEWKLWLKEFMKK